MESRSEDAQHENGGLAQRSQREPLLPGNGPHRIRSRTRAGRVRYAKHSSHGNHNMNVRAVIALIGSALLLIADSSTERSRFYVTRVASTLVDQGLASHVPSSSEG